MPNTGAQAPAVELRGLSKAFGACVANAEIHLRVEPGTIHAVIGENGAGKSTAMKMLYGIYSPDTGEILIDGQPRRWRSPSDAIAAGIGMVHQHFMLAGPYTVLENILVGAEPAAGWARWIPRFLRPVDRNAARAKLERISAQYGLKVDLDAPVEDLSVGVQQRIEILKLLYRDAKILILDEPTAVLTPQETSELFVNLKKLCHEGKTVLIITHKLKEVLSVADHVTVFRAGRIAGERKVSETDSEDLASLMVGRKVSLHVQAPPAPVLGEPVLELQNVSLAPLDPKAGKSLLTDLRFAVRAGEVVGIAGVEGNGQSELLQILLHAREFGARASGAIRILGRDVMNGSVRMTTAQVRDLEIGVIPEDRHKQALLLECSVRDNFLLGLQHRKPFNRRGLIAFGELEKAASRAIEEYDVRPRSLDIATGRMSGGNQQKVIIAREFERKPRFLIAAQPTRGVDVGAIEFIHKRIIEARTAGAGVLLVSSELDEVLDLSDRILVMYGGQIVAEFERGKASPQELGIFMGGGRAATDMGGGRK